MSYIPSRLNALSFSITKLLILYLCYSYFGIIKGCIFFFLLSRFYTFFMRYTFQYHRFSEVDALLVNESNSVFNMNIGAIFTLDSIDGIEKIKHSLISKLFKKLPKLSSKVVFLLGEYFFDCSKHDQYTEKDYLDKFIEVDLSRTDFKAYIENELSRHMDIFNDFGLQFHIIKFKNDGKISEDCNLDEKTKGVLFLKINHMLSDGLGVVNLIGFMDDHYSVSKFPRFLKRQKLNFFKNLINEIYLNFLAFTHGFLIFKETADEAKPGIFSAEEVHGMNFDQRNMILSKFVCMDLNAIKEYSKKEKISINEIVTDAILRALHKNYPNVKKMAGMIPIRFNSLAENIKDLDLKNDSNICIFSSEAPYDEDKTRNRIRFNMKRNAYLSKLNKLIIAILSEFVSLRYLNSIKKETITDMCISNVPGQEEFMYIGGSKITNAIPVGENYAFMYEVMIGSYSGKLNVCLATKTKYQNNLNSIANDIQNEILLKLAKKIN